MLKHPPSLRSASLPQMGQHRLKYGPEILRVARRPRILLLVMWFVSVLEADASGNWQDLVQAFDDISVGHAQDERACAVALVGDATFTFKQANDPAEFKVSKRSHAP